MISINEHIGGQGKQLAGIDSLCADYEAESARLEEMIAALERDLEAVKTKHLTTLKRQAGVVARREGDLRSAVEAAPSLFIRPRTVTLHGIKVGLANSVGRLLYDDAETVLRLIRKFRPKDVEALIRTFSEPNKDALKLEGPGELARLGCRIEGAGDVVVVRRVAGDVEKLIDKLIEKLVEAMVAE